MWYLYLMDGVHPYLLSVTSSARNGGLLIFSLLSARLLSQDYVLLILSLPRHLHCLLVFQADLYPWTNTPLHIADCQSIIDIFSNKFRYILNISSFYCLVVFSWMILGIIISMVVLPWFPVNIEVLLFWLIPEPVVPQVPGFKFFCVILLRTKEFSVALSVLIDIGVWGCLNYLRIYRRGVNVW